jgi:hypothetical protein
MQITNRAPLYPSRCAITNRSDDEMLDTGNHIPAPAYSDGIRVYVSRAGAEKAGKFFGMVPQAQYEAQAEQLRERTTELAEATAELESLRETVQHIKFLENTSFKPRERAPRNDRGTTKKQTDTPNTQDKPRKESQPA